MPALTEAQLREFLTDQPHLMKLATLNQDGWPYVNPVWYDYDGEVFRIAGRRNARWVENIRRDSRVSLCIDTYDAPYTRVLMEASADVEEEGWMPVSPGRAIRYLGEEAGRRYFGETGHIPRALIRVRPRKVVTWTGGEWHPRYRE